MFSALQDFNDSPLATCIKREAESGLPDPTAQSSQGSTSLVMTKADGDEVGHVLYDGYGAVLASTVPATLTTTLAGSGDVPDPDTGLVYLGAGCWYPTLRSGRVIRRWGVPCSQTRPATQPLISDTIPADGSVITTSWPVISATLTDPESGSGVRPLSTTLIIDSEVATPQVNTAGGLAFTPSVRLTDGVHSLPAQVYDQAGNQTQSGP